MRRLAVMVCLVACRMGFDPVANEARDGSTGMADGTTSPTDALAFGPIASWGFDEAGQAVTDLAGSLDGVLGATAAVEARDPQRTTTPTRVCTGSALTFDGLDDVVTISNPSPANLSRFAIGFSMVADGDGGGTLPRIFTKEDGAGPDVIVHFRAADNAIAVNIFNTTDTLHATFGAGVVRGTRANWVVSYDDAGDRRIHIYKNGVETNYLRQDAMTGTLKTTTANWRIGNQASGVRGFDGTIDAIAVYDVPFGATEAAALSASCPP